MPVCLLLGLLLLHLACKPDNRALVVGKIQNADLATTEFVVDKIVFGAKTKRIVFIKVSEATFMAYSQAKIKTGIDLNKIKESDIQIEGKNLPQVATLSNHFSYPLQVLWRIPRSPTRRFSKPHQHTRSGAVFVTQSWTSGKTYSIWGSSKPPKTIPGNSSGYCFPLWDMRKSTSALKVMH